MNERKVFEIHCFQKQTFLSSEELFLIYLKEGWPFQGSTFAQLCQQSMFPGVYQKPPDMIVINKSSNNFYHTKLSVVMDHAVYQAIQILQSNQQTLPVIKFPLTLKLFLLRGDWVVQSVKHLTLAQVMISWFVNPSPSSGCLLSGQSPLQILCPSLCVPPLPALCLSLKNK